jgi:phosphoenolpyruvate-protein phosphotransferase/dihydroxyacetone kinase phosphotransfer subunit
MISLVLVSHSRALALALKETLEKLYGNKTPPIAVAAGAGADGAELGTDATAIMAAVEEAGSAADGVLVLLDLGSAILSAEMALELLDEPLRAKVSLCSAPLVEGAIAAAAQSSIGATLAEVRAEAEGALRQKIEHLIPISAAPAASAPPLATLPGEPVISTTLRVENPHGLHARPAMRIVQTVAKFSSLVQIENVRTGNPPVSARSVVAINCLDARAGDRIRFTARGADAVDAIAALESLQASQFGDLYKEASARIEAGVAGREVVTPAVPDMAETGQFPRGEPLSEGVAWGQLVFVARVAPVLPPPNTMIDAPAELAKLHAALASVRRQLDEDAERLGDRLGETNAGILQAHRMLADDPALIEPATAFIREEGLPAAHAWQKSSSLAVESYLRLGQPLLRERARDVEDLGQRVLTELGVVASLKFVFPAGPCVVALPTLLPSEVLALDPRQVLGIIAEAIGPTSHAAILLRAAGIATVDGVNLARLRAAFGPAAGPTVALDGGTGEVWLSPTEAEQRALALRRRQLAAAASRQMDDPAPAPLHTRDGRRVELAANVASAADVQAAVRAGAEAIGLLRTEFLFFGRSAPPTEDEQTAALQRMVTPLRPAAPVTVRTFDIGGDKPVPYLAVGRESNPFLGIRGVRLALKHADLFFVHLRAILRAGDGRRFRVMFPMVTEVEEIRRAVALLNDAHAELTLSRVAHAWPVEVGMMVEVPAAALNVHSFVREVDFFSIGTNDLTQYTLAAERGHAELASFADALHPAVLRLVRRVAAIAAANGKWTGICGEAAADPIAAGVFIGLGVQELSMAAAAVRTIRSSLAAIDYRQSQRRARQCLKAASSDEVRRLWSE